MNNKMTVCVRKRPRTAREVKLNDRDVVEISDHQMVVVDEPKVAVDLTKFIQQACIHCVTYLHPTTLGQRDCFLIILFRNTQLRVICNSFRELSMKFDTF